MMTRVLPAREAGAIAAAAREAAHWLRQGDVVGLPTETVYGLGCNALDERAAAKVFAAKERPAFDPLIVHVADASWIDRLAQAGGSRGAMARALAEAFWPGPLTLVLPAQDAVPDLVRSGLPTVALRCSAHPVIAAVLTELGCPVAAPSANRFGRISPVTAEDVVEELGGRIPLVVDGGPCRHGLESTIVEVGEGVLRVLRPGPVPREAIEAFGPTELAGRDAPASAPGMLASHYAPRTPLTLLPPGGGPAAEDAASSGLLCFGACEQQGFARVEALPSDPVEAAPRFFAALRRLDAAGLGRIYAMALPETGLGVAIMDRLRRAAHG